MSSGETSSVVRRTVRRNVGGGVSGDGDNVEVIRNYQVFRGLSPNTASRLEARLRELEDALEAERQARLRAEQELSDLSSEFTIISERLEEAEGAGGAQSEYARKRDAEYQKLKKDYDLLSSQHESEISSNRKRNQDAINQLSDQLDALNKSKNKWEKEKQALLFELENSNQALDASNKARAQMEAKLESLEEQLRRLKSQLEEILRQNGDLNAWKAKLSQENHDLHRQLQDMENQLSNLNKSKLLLQATCDDLKSQLDDAISAKNSLSVALNNLQLELESNQAKLEEETDLCNNFKFQLQKTLADLGNLKVKYDQDINIRLGEFEDARRKSQLRITELEDLLDQSRSKCNKLEKEKLKLTIEIRDIASELEAANLSSGDLSKRLRNQESISLEFQKKQEELNSLLGANGNELQRLQAENGRLKAALESLQDKFDSALRENKKLSDALRESQGQNKDLSRQIQDLLHIKSQLEAEKDRLMAENIDLHDALKDAQARLEASNSTLNQLKIDFEHRIREKDDEIENTRKSGQRGVDELQKSIMEVETKYKNEIGRLRKKNESDIHEFEIQLENLSRSNAELVRANKSLAVRVKDLEIALETERAGAEDARNSLTISERKRIALQTELEDLRALLEAAERARKNAESQLAENSSKFNELNLSLSAALNDRKRMEGDLATVASSFEEANAARRAAEDRADKLQLEVNRLAGELARAQENFAQADSIRKSLENELRELSLRLEEAENFAQREGKRLVAKLQGRIKDLEAELEAEQRRNRDLSNENKKVIKQLVELRGITEEDKRIISELTEQINALQSKIALYKRQLLEADEVINITLAKYRKAQQQLEEYERKSDSSMEKNITVHINRGASAMPHLVHHTSVHPRARSMSVSRETHRIIRA